MTLHQFIKEKLVNEPHLKRLHRSEAVFFRWYIKSYGITEYLSQQEGQSLTHAETLEVGLFLLHEFGVSPANMKKSLQVYQKRHHIDMNEAVLLFPETSWELLALSPFLGSSY